MKCEICENNRCRETFKTNEILIELNTDLQKENKQLKEQLQKAQDTIEAFLISNEYALVTDNEGIRQQ